MRTGLMSLLTLAVLAISGMTLLSQPPDAVVTRIQVTQLHCNNCLKSVAEETNKVPGVAGTTGDFKTNLVVVVHRPGMNPSPRALWEAVVNADHKPTRIESPVGTWTKKPPQ